MSVRAGSAAISSAGGIEVRAVRRAFGAVLAVEHMDLSAPPGAITALVGPNGAGKTTLMLMLATLLSPDSGEIRIAGHDPVRAPGQVRARMGWMPDSFGSYETLTAREVLEFVGAAYRLSRPARAARAAELLERMHLTEFADRPVHVLSRGQKQRLGLARAIVHRPSVLLLDEPAAGLDPRSRVDLLGLLRNLADDGAAILVSGHILADLEETADIVVLVSGGRTASAHRVSDRRAAAETAAPWRVRALEPDLLLAALAGYGVVHAQPDASGVEVMLQGDDEAADLLAALIRDGVRVATLAPTGGAPESAYLAMTDERA